MRIGLMGGTYNPPHAGHCAIAQTALSMLELDALWWLVTPQNPLKKDMNLPSTRTRIQQSKELLNNPFILVTDIEEKIGSFSTYDSVLGFKKHFPMTDFIWIAGYDNALSFHKWENWQELLHLIPFCFIARPPAVSLIEKCPLRLDISVNHKPLTKAFKWPLERGVCYYILQMHMISLSSTQMRESIIYQ